MTAIGNITRRGYTDHTTLDNLALVHMNGRVYDPAIGRFLSSDPYVQFPLSAQSYNRYSYVLNNPLSFTDPSGYFLSGLKKFVKKYWKPIVAIAAAVVTYGAATGWIATAAGNSAYAAALAVPGATAGTASLYGATAYTAAAGAWSTASNSRRNERCRCGRVLWIDVWWNSRSLRQYLEHAARCGKRYRWRIVIGGQWWQFWEGICDGNWVVDCSMGNRANEGR
jgi:RHS repeat-associated protein